uniref:WD domain-containing protein, G-beta repeat-containing protein n=1 Tax=Candidatus Kentrum sp. DK TaxID=2126562 RepID=A0A450T5Q9_9GAMM|nr:MAG: WD domain-containing protein, G-beta repeat-containing protein [Candidatus Kentron sp. DK]
MTNATPAYSRALFSLLTALAVLLPALVVLPAWAAGPPTEPLLRLETGRHTAPIRSIATDRAGRWIVSASDDKTVRLWAADSGRLLRTVRPPIGEGDEGKLYAVAMDPQGDWIAAAGWTGDEWDNTYSIYLLERASGRLFKRLTGLENGIAHLAVSADGQWLAACLGGKNGLRVFDAKNGFRPVFADRDYGDSSYGAAFSPDGRRLVTSSLDGQLRLYRIEAGAQDGAGVGDEAGLPRFSLDKKARLEGGQEPFAVAFHPAPGDDRLAVGFRDGATVQVLDGRDLTPRYAADSRGLYNGNLGRVAWSADGERLLAGGRYDDGGPNPVLAWDQGGRGARAVWPAADNTIMDLKALPDGGLAVATGDPRLLVLEATGARRLALAAGIADMRDTLGDDFRLSHDGSRIAFGLGLGGEAPVWFDIDQRRLQRGPAPADDAPGKGLLPPRLTAPGLVVDGWKNQYQPELNGKRLKLRDYETAHSLAVTPDGERLLLGTDWRLRLFDKEGRQRWEKAVPGTAWGVNISGDGRLAVAAFHDGTLRWYRLEDGEPLLSLFVSVPGPGEGEAEAGNGNANKENTQKDNANKANDWVLWSPSGYYDASPGGGRLIGWHLNNGKDQAADFYPASSLRQRFYRPDVVAQVLGELDEGKALARAGVEPAPLALALPPTVELLLPVDGEGFASPRLAAQYRIHGKGDMPITGVRFLLDGRPLAGVDAPKPVPGVDQYAPLTLPQRDLTLSLIAENQYGASTPASARLAWVERSPAAGPDREGADRGTALALAPKASVIRPRLYLLAIGISGYDDEKLRLGFAAKDAQDFARALEQQRGRGLYREVVVKLLADADRGEVLDGLDWLRREVTEKDVGVLFLAGHGANDDDGDYYFLPRDAGTRRLRRSAVAYFEVKKTLRNLAGKALAFIDTCHSGNVMGGRRGVADINVIINDLAAAENGVVVFASSSGRQFSYEKSDWGNGAFTKALVEGIDGKANYTKDGRITINQLDLYLSERVKELTGGRQTPTTNKPPDTPDFPIVVMP